MNCILDGLTRPARELPPPANPVPHSPFKLQNRLRLEVVGPDGVVKQRTPWLHNIMTTFGLASLASRVGTSSGANVNTTTEFVSCMRIGTGTTAATSNDASLVASTGSVTIGNASFTKTNAGARTVSYRATFASDNPAGTAVINEIGLFLNSTTHDAGCAARSVLGTASVNKGASDVINVSYDTVYTTA